MGLLSNSAVAHPCQNQTWVPPSPEFAVRSCEMHDSYQSILQMSISYYSCWSFFFFFFFNLNFVFVIQHLTGADPGMGRSGPAPSFDSQIMQIQPFFGLYQPFGPPLFTNLDTRPPLFTNPASAPASMGGGDFTGQVNFEFCIWCILEPFLSFKLVPHLSKLIKALEKDWKFLLFYLPFSKILLSISIKKAHCHKDPSPFNALHHISYDSDLIDRINRTTSSWLYSL